MPSPTVSDAMTEPAPVFWLTGLSGAGKTTIARALAAHLRVAGSAAALLDGDDFRRGVSRDLGFDDADRRENVRRAAEVARLLSDQGIMVVCAFMSPTAEAREEARAIVGDARFCLIHIDASLHACESRDTKGLYARARAGELTNFTGVDAVSEVPTDADLRVKTDALTPADSVAALVSYAGEAMRRRTIG